MQSRRDQVQAQSSVLGRLSRALVAADPDVIESPTKRTRNGSLAGLLIGCLMVAGFAGYGMVVPGGSTVWRKPGTLIVEKETGNRYILVGGVLRPVANRASAMLLLGTKMTVKHVSRKSLRGVGHGLTIGIAGAPDDLPVPGASAATTWTACAARGASGAAAAPAAPAAATTLELTRRPVGAAPSAGQALTVVGNDGTRYLVWAGRRHRLTEPWLSRVLGFDDTQLIPVAPEWLAVVAEGPDITPIRLRGAGKARSLGGRQVKVGQLFVFAGQGGVRNHYLLLEDGSFTPVTSMAVQIVRGDPQRAGAGLNSEPIQLDPSQRAGIQESVAALLPRELPESAPTPVRLSAGQALCARYRPGSPGVEVVLGSAMARIRAVEPQGGALVVPGWPGQTSGGTQFLVTDTGMRYPVATVAVAERLGYPKGTAVAIPPPLLDLLPPGPALDPAAISR
jgi:type VII secretion protein EccB